MSDIEITIRLPEMLLERARAVGLVIEDQVDTIAEAVEKEILRREAAKRLLEIAAKLDTLPDELKPSPEEIVAAVRQARAEIAAEHDSDTSGY
jgi:hypothetical protein